MRSRRSGRCGSGWVIDLEACLEGKGGDEYPLYQGARALHFAERALLEDLYRRHRMDESMECRRYKSYLTSWGHVKYELVCACIGYFGCLPRYFGRWICHCIKDYFLLTIHAMRDSRVR
jgi:hypothetical protein